MISLFDLVRRFSGVFLPCLLFGQDLSDATGIHMTKATPNVFIANSAHGASGKKLVDDREVLAFVQTQQGRVMFTPGGAFFGLAVPADGGQLHPKSRPGKTDAFDQVRETEFVVMRAGFDVRSGVKRGVVPRLVDRTNCVANFLVGPRHRWRVNLPTFARLVYDDVWQGITLEYRAHQDYLEFALIVEPGADPSVIVMETGAEQLALLDSGELDAQLFGGHLRLGKPFAYQEIDGVRQAVEVAYAKGESGRFGFTLGEYNPHRTLVIDPSLTWSTFLGGMSHDEVYAIAVDSDGNAFVTGYTESSEFPTTAGAYDQTYNGLHDVFVVKLHADGSDLIYATFIGGAGSDDSDGIALDDAGNAYVTGWTSSPDFPTTPGAFDDTFNGSSDVFVVKLNADGSDLLYASFLGGTGDERGYGVAVDESGQAFVTGYTYSNGFPSTIGSFDETHNGLHDGFVCKINDSGSDLLYATFLGGSAYDVCHGIALDGAGLAHVTGVTESVEFPTTPGVFDETHNGSGDVFVCSFNADGSDLSASTFLGGAGYDKGQGIAVDSMGRAFVTGTTQSSDFPTVAGSYDETHNGSNDAFVVRLNADATALDYATFLGGPNWDYGYGIAVDGAGNAYVTGETSSYTFPTTSGAYDETYNGFYDVFVVKLDSLGAALSYATFLGGIGYDVGFGIDVDGSGNVYVTGRTESEAFPTTAGAYNETHSGSRDVFVACLSLFCYPLATATVSGEDTICSGQTISVRADLTGTPPWDVTWSDGTIYTGIPISPLMHDVSPVETTTYTVTHIGDLNCLGTSAGQAVIAVAEEFAVSTVPERVVAQGIQPRVFEAFVVCDSPPTEFEWTIPATGFSFGVDINPITLDPIPNETIDTQIRVTDQAKRATLTHLVRLLAAVDSTYFDLNGDGCNNVADIWAFCDDWRTEMPALTDPNGDGIVDIVDFLYINLDDPYPCPGL